MFKRFQNGVDRQRAKQFKKVLDKMYTNYLCGKVMFENTGNEAYTYSLVNASTKWGDPETAEEIIANLKRMADMLSRRAGK